MRHVRRGGRLAALLATASVALTACAGLPTSSSPHVLRTVVDQSSAAEPQGPSQGQQPEQVVREFIHAAALTDYDSAGESFAAAREFLTPAAQKSWQADSSATPVIVLADDFAAVPGDNAPSSVTVTGRQVGELEPDRSYKPVDSTEYQVTMHLTKKNDRWHISDPPSTVLLTQSDFSTAFRQRFVYFLDSTGRVVVPDIRYIPSSQSPDLTANRLMDLLLGGPSHTLSGAARTQLGHGATLRSNVHIDDSGVAHVDLEGVDVSTASARQALAAQVVWTLNTDVQRIAITVNGLPLAQVGAGSDSGGGPTASAEPADSVYSVAKGSVASFSPDRVPGSGQAVSDAYYIDEGTILRLSDSTPMWGSVGTGSVDVLSASLSAASGALAAVTREADDDERLIVGRPFDHKPTVTALEAGTLTKPSFTRWGYSAWTVQNGATQPEIYQVSVASGSPTWSRVAAPDLGTLGPVTALALSPDGVRVALVAGGSLYLGVISPVTDEASGSRSSDDDSAADHRRLQVTGLTLLRPDLTDVGPITWDDSTNLLVGAKATGSRHRTVFGVSVDGRSIDPLTTSQESGPVFGDVQAIAASGSDLPMLISYGGRVWQLQGSRTTGRWVPPEGRNWMTGSMPFYPS